MYQNMSLKAEPLNHYFVQESSEFHKRGFESAVDSIRAIAASHLWQVLSQMFSNVYVTIIFSCDLLLFFSAACGCSCRLKWPPEGLKRLFSFSKRRFLSGRMDNISSLCLPVKKRFFGGARTLVMFMAGVDLFSSIEALTPLV